MNPNQNSSRSVKRLYLDPPEELQASPELSPHFFFEARVDIDDVRSGYHEVRSVSSALELHPFDGEAALTADLFRPVDASRIRTEVPAGSVLRPLPEWVTEDRVARAEVQFILHLTRHLTASFYRNYALKAYSRAGETLEDFQNRCLDALSEPFRAELDDLREVFNRRLSLLRDRNERELRSDELASARVTLRKRDCLSAATEDVDELFLAADLHTGIAGDARCLPCESKSEIEERASGLAAEARDACQRLIRTYRERGLHADQYSVHPGPQDIHVVRTCILWMPAEAGRS